MNTINNARRKFFGKLVAGLGTLWVFGRSHGANATGEMEVRTQRTYDRETERRLALCRRHFWAEQTEAEFANLPADDVGNPHFKETMKTLVENPKYIHNGRPRDGHSNILNGYNAFFAKYTNVRFEEIAHYIAENAIVFEVTLHAEERGDGRPPLKSIALSIMVAFIFDKVGGDIAGEHIYFDSKQLVAE